MPSASVTVLADYRRERASQVAQSADRRVIRAATTEWDRLEHLGLEMRRAWFRAWLGFWLGGIH